MLLFVGLDLGGLDLVELVPKEIPFGGQGPHPLAPGFQGVPGLGPESVGATDFAGRHSSVREGVEDLPLSRPPQQGLVVVLPVEVDQASSQVSHLPRRGGGSVDPGAIAALGLNFPPQDQEPVLVRRDPGLVEGGGDAR